MMPVGNKTREWLVEQYIEALKQDSIPWERGWSEIGQNRNAITGKAYRGVNALVLGMAQAQNLYTDPRWCTFNQAKDKGWTIKRGNHGVPLEFWSIYDKVSKQTVSQVEYKDLILSGQRTEKDFRVVCRTFTVFNGEQVEGMPELIIPKNTAIEMDTTVENMIQNMGVSYREQGDQAYYSPVKDEITLPMREYFKDSYSYHATKLHEMSHATGHASRLQRDLSGGFGSYEYAKEELRAEIGSSFVMQELGLQFSQEHIENHKAYIQSWIDILQKEPQELFLAIKDAEKITDYLMEKGSLERTEVIHSEVNKTSRIESEEVHNQEIPNMNIDFYLREEKAKKLERFKNEYENQQIAQAWVMNHQENGDEWKLSIDKEIRLQKENNKVEVFATCGALLLAYEMDIAEDVMNHVEYLSQEQIQYLGLKEPEPINMEEPMNQVQKDKIQKPRVDHSAVQNGKIHYSYLAKEIDRQLSIADIVQEAGFTLVKNGSTSFKTEEHNSLVLDMKKNRFYWNSKPPLESDINRARKIIAKTGKGQIPTVLQGGVVSFYMHVYKKDFTEAVKDLISRIDPTLDLHKDKAVTIQSDVSTMNEEQRHKMLYAQLREHKYQNVNMKQSIAYLVKTRGIEPEIVNLFIKRNMLVQTSDEKGRTQTVFLGKNENGYLSSVCFRSNSSNSSFKGDYSGCDYSRGWFFEPTKEIPFGWHKSQSPSVFNTNKQLLVFESNIEMLSYMSILKLNNIDYRNYAYLSCGSISKTNCIKETCTLYGYKNVVIMFNNDKDKGDKNPGLIRAIHVSEQLKQDGINARPLVPSSRNDWNDTLIAYKKKEITLDRDKGFKKPALSMAR